MSFLIWSTNRKINTSRSESRKKKKISLIFVCLDTQFNNEIKEKAQDCMITKKLIKIFFV